MLLKRLLSFSLIDLREYENFNRIFLVSNWLSLVMNYWHYYYSNWSFGMAVAKSEMILWSRFRSRNFLRVDLSSIILGKAG